MILSQDPTQAAEQQRVLQAVMAGLAESISATARAAGPVNPAHIIDALRHVALCMEAGVEAVDLYGQAPAN